MDPQNICIYLIIYLFKAVYFLATWIKKNYTSLKRTFSPLTDLSDTYSSMCSVRIVIGVRALFTLLLALVLSLTDPCKQFSTVNL